MLEEAHKVVGNITQHIEEKHDLQKILMLTRQHELEKTY